VTEGSIPLEEILTMSRIPWGKMTYRQLEKVCEWAHLHGRTKYLNAARREIRKRDMISMEPRLESGT